MNPEKRLTTFDASNQGGGYTRLGEGEHKSAFGPWIIAQRTKCRLTKQVVDKNAEVAGNKQNTNYGNQT